MLASVETHAAMTNLVVNGEFESPSFSGDWAKYAHNSGALGSQWNTQSFNNFQLNRQGFRAPTTGADSNPSGQYLEVRGDSSSGIITLTINVPSNIVAGSNATFNFDSHSLNNGGASLTSGVYRIQVAGVNAFDSTPTNTSNVSNAWRTYTQSLTLSPGDTVTVTWQETGGSNIGVGLQIDDVELLAQIVPEPATIGALSLAAFMFLSSMRRKRRYVPLSALLRVPLLSKKHSHHSNRGSNTKVSAVSI